MDGITLRDNGSLHYQYFCLPYMESIPMRPEHDEWALRLAEVVAQRATCLRRSVGCVLTNERNQVLATGYNGRAAGLPHCNEERVDFSVTDSKEWGKQLAQFPHACAASKAASGTQLEGCEAIHAEQNALLQCRDVYAIETCYVTHSPCTTCVKLLMNTGCKRIVFRERYAHDEAAMKLWLPDGGEPDDKLLYPNEGRKWIHLPRS